VSITTTAKMAAAPRWRQTEAGLFMISAAGCERSCEGAEARARNPKVRGVSCLLTRGGGQLSVWDRVSLDDALGRAGPRTRPPRAR
jgi:hypothetical protein